LVYELLLRHSGVFARYVDYFRHIAYHFLKDLYVAAWHQVAEIHAEDANGCA
jgi:hypothetical protein